MAQVSALVVGLLLAGCGGGGGGGGVVSTPSPTPSASYTKIVDMSGDRTFQTAGVQYGTSGVPGLTNGSALALGSGITVAYTQASDSYKLTAPDGTTTTFDPSNVVPPSPSIPNSQSWAKMNGTMRDQLFLIVPTVNGVALSYTIVGSWARFDSATGQGQVRLAVGGVPTIASDMPRTGSATYAVQTGGTVAQNGMNFTLNGNSSATFSANFAANSVTTSLTLAGLPANGVNNVFQFGTFNGNGTISSSGPGFTGTINGTNGVTGVFSGAFFGPQALEMGYSWYMSGGNFSAAGTATGLKQ